VYAALPPDNVLAIRCYKDKHNNLKIIKNMKVLVINYTHTAKIWLDLPAIPEKGEYLEFSVLDGLEGLSLKEKKLAEDSSEFIDDDNEENECGNPVYVVTNRTFYNNGVVELIVRMEEWV
jgi:hypothetical protein